MGFSMQTKLKVSELLEQVKEFDQAGSFLQLLDAVNILLLKDPNNSEYVLYKLKALDGLGKVSSDIKLLEHYVNMRSTDSTGFILLYQAYLEKKDTAGALIALSYALSVNPDDEQCMLLLLELLKKVDPKYKRVKINILTLKRIGHLSSEIEPLMRKVKGQDEQDC